MEAERAGPTEWRNGPWNVRVEAKSGRIFFAIRGLTRSGASHRHTLKTNGATMAAEKTIEQRVKAIITEQLGVNPDQVTPDAKFIEDLGADSLDTVELVMALEEEFGQEIPDEEAEKLQSVGDVIKYIEEKQK